MVMKKKTATFVSVFVLFVVIGIAIFQKRPPAVPITISPIEISSPAVSQKPPQTPPAAAKKPMLEEKNLPIIQTPAVPAGEPQKKPAEMDEQEFQDLVESFEVTAVMRDLLDDGEDVKAIYEARTLLHHPNQEVRLEVAKSLEWIGLPAAMELAKMLDDDDADIREIAQDAFWNALDEAENPVLKRDLMAEALLSKDPEIRMRVLDEAVFLPDTLSFGLMTYAMEDPDHEVAELAHENAEFVSGEEFSSRKEAETWFLANQADLADLEEAE